MLVDSHCHLDFPEFAGNIDAIVARANNNDVQVMQTICTHISKFQQVLDVAKRYDNVYCSVGVHPHHADEEAEQLSSPQPLIDFARHEKVIGIGETGLDYFYENAPEEDQKRSFIHHIHAAQETQLPLIVHSRDADEDTLDILSFHMKEKSFPGLIHCFSTKRELAAGAIDLGMSVSIAGIVTFKKATELQDIVKDLPLESLLVETDAPFLAPTPHRGKTNEPAFTRHTAEFIAQLKDIPYDMVAKTTTDNFFTLFSKASRS